MFYFKRSTRPIGEIQDHQVPKSQFRVVEAIYTPTPIEKVLSPKTYGQMSD